MECLSVSRSLTTLAEVRSFKSLFKLNVLYLFKELFPLNNFFVFLFVRSYRDIDELFNLKNIFL